MLAVFNRGLKRFGKVFGYQKGKVGIGSFILFGFVCMAVYHCQSVFIVFGSDLAGRVGTESTNFVVKGRGIVDQLGFVEIFI